MYGNPYMPQTFNRQEAVDRINAQMNELEKMKQQMQQPAQPQQVQQPITQNFQLAPQNRDVIRYATSIDEVNRDMVIGDTPYFSKDMSVVWIKNTKGDIKTYELTEIIPKDEKDLRIEYLEAQLEEIKKGMIKNESNAVVNEPVADTTESKKSPSVSTVSKSTKKSK